jgi:IS1 family transposase
MVVSIDSLKLHDEELWRKQGSEKEYIQTAKLSTYGLSAEQIADVLDRDVRTIQEWLSGISEKSQRFHKTICLIVGLTLQFLQMDELWSYLQNKNRQMWVFVGLDPLSKFWINFELSSRTNNTANKLLKNLKPLLKVNPNDILKVTTDKLSAYKNALEKQFKEIPYVYLQIVKERVKRKLKTVKKFFVKGKQEDFPEGTQNTSYIERLNLTLRLRISYLHRKTLGYCKKQANLNRTLWINLFDYNYVQFHRSLRIDLTQQKKQFHKRYKEMTPAMKIGLTSSQLSWRDLLVVPISKSS